MIGFNEQILMGWLSPIFWPFLRVLAVFSVAPIFSSRALPVRIRVALALLVAWGASGAILNQPVVPLNGPNAIDTTVHEVLVGLSIGFAVRLVFAAAELAGELIGLQMGLNFAGFFDPASSTQGSALASFFGQLTALLFITINGHLLLLMAVVRSYERIPLGSGVVDMLRQARLHEMGAQVFASAFWMALPLTVLLLLANLALGIMSRIAPQMNIFAIGFPITLVTGLGGLALILPLMDRSLLALLEGALTRVWFVR